MQVETLQITYLLKHLGHKHQRTGTGNVRHSPTETVIGSFEITPYGYVSTDGFFVNKNKVVKVKKWTK